MTFISFRDYKSQCWKRHACIFQGSRNLCVTWLSTSFKKKKKKKKREFLWNWIAELMFKYRTDPVWNRCLCSAMSELYQLSHRMRNWVPQINDNSLELWQAWILTPHYERFSHPTIIIWYWLMGVNDLSEMLANMSPRLSVKLQPWLIQSAVRKFLSKTQI